MSMAVWTRVSAPAASKAAWRASALMTVASMPLWSAVLPSMPAWLAVAPRQMFPPPTTAATWTPIRQTSRISPASRRTTLRSIPKPPSPARASPLSFTTIRRYSGCSTSSPLPPGPSELRAPSGLGRRRLFEPLAPLEAREAAHSNVFAKAGGHFLHHLLHPAVRILHEGLLHKAALLEKLLQPALHDPVQNVLRLPLVPGGRLIHPALGLDDRLGPLFPPDPIGPGRGHVHGEILHQVLELLRLGDEIGLAVDLDEDTNAAVPVDVGAHQALGGRPARPLGRLSQALLPEDLNGPLQVPVGLHKGLLTIHHARAGPLAQLLDQRCRNLCHVRDHSLARGSRRDWGKGEEGGSPPLRYTSRTSSSSSSSAGITASSAASASGDSDASVSCRPSLPSRTASAMRLVRRRMARMASSFPGMT